MRLGIFGGLFNPPHLGHLILAQEALAQLELDQVLFVPVGRPSHRRVEQDPGAETRWQMCQRALDGDDRFALSRLEIDRAAPSYSVDTLRELGREAPDADLVMLIGGDQAAALRSWREPEEILTLARVAVAERDQWRREEISERLAGMRGAERISFFEMPRVEISSTLVRRRAAAGRPIRYLVPDTVEDFISARSLYDASMSVPAR